MMRLFLLVAFFLTGCTSPAPVVPGTVLTAPPTPPTPAVGTTAYLALGDSYTIGEGALAADRWPVQMAMMARQQGIALAEPDIIARTGWTTSELQQAIASSGNMRRDYGLVSLLIGVNNQYRGQSVEGYKTQFRALLHTAAAFAGGNMKRVVVLSIPDWGQTPYAAGQDQERIAREIDQFNTAAQAECQQLGVAYVDITPLTRMAVRDRSQFTSDGLHYSGTQMRMWAERALPVVKKLLE